MLKIVTIVGARPQFIKAATVSRVVRKTPGVEEILVHTGQHFDKNMSEVFFEEMDIPKPKYNLEINSLGHGAMTGRMMEEIEKVLLTENPDWVLVYGDTNSTIAGALAAKKLHIKVAHVEAGLRSFNMRMPEEVNRILTDRISDILFCPTQAAIDNLDNEGYKNIDIEICNVGDVMFDAALFYKERMQKPNIDVPSQFILSTIHRAENTGDENKMRNIINAFNEISEDIPVILPVHPRTKNIIKELNLKPNFTIVEPLSYLEIVYMLSHCSMVMTDSGGMQKEAYFFEKQCLTLRDQTEWVELIHAGVNSLVDTSEKANILSSFNNARNMDVNFSGGLYGEGDSAEKIIKRLRT